MRQLLAVWCFGLVLGFGQGAAALSCLPPNLAEDFNRYQLSMSVYKLALGKFERLSPNVKLTDGDGGITYKVRFTGRPLAKKGFGTTFSQDLTTIEPCVSEWCGKTPDASQDVVVFLPASEDAEISFGPCDLGHFQTDKEVLDVLRECIQNGTCTDDMIRRAGGG